MRVRRARANEVGAILDHLWDVYGEVRTSAEALARQIGDADLFCVAEADGLIVGTLEVMAGEVGLSVRPAWRRRGIGRALLAAVPGHVILRVAEENVAALRLYRACGFEERECRDGIVSMSRA